MIVIEEINKEFVLKRITEEQIFCYYMGISHIDYKKFYKNDKLRTDNDSGCKFYVNKNSKILYFKDFAWRSFDCFDYVGTLYNITGKKAFNKIILQIAKDFNLIDSSLPSNTIQIFKQKPPERKIYDFEYKNWNTRLVNYWKKYISWITIQDLNNYNIRPLFSYSIDKEVKYKVPDSEIAFIYQLDKHAFQVYAPFKLKNELKFLTTETKILGLKSIDYSKKYILITKSYKDFVLARLLGVNCIGILAETIRLTIDAQLEIDKFDYAFTLFDNDLAGKKASIYYRDTYKTTPLLFPKIEPKDFSDNLEKYGENDMYELMTDIASRFSLFF